MHSPALECCASWPDNFETGELCLFTVNPATAPVSSGNVVQSYNQFAAKLVTNESRTFSMSFSDTIRILRVLLERSRNAEDRRRIIHHAVMTARLGYYLFAEQLSDPIVHDIQYAHWTILDVPDGAPEFDGHLDRLVLDTAALAVAVGDEDFLAFAQHVMGVNESLRDRDAMAAIIDNPERRARFVGMLDLRRAVVAATRSYLAAAWTVAPTRLNRQTVLSLDADGLDSAAAVYQASAAAIPAETWDSVVRRLLESGNSKDRRLAREVMVYLSGVTIAEMGEADYRHLFRQIPKLRVLVRQAMDETAALRSPNPSGTVAFTRHPDGWSHIYSGESLAAYGETVRAALPVICSE